MTFQISHAIKKAVILLLWQDLFQLIIAEVKLTVTPSTTVDVDQFVTLQCRLDPNPFPPVIMSIFINRTTHCTLETNNGACKSTNGSCANRYTSACPNETFFTVQIQVLKDWNGTAIYCASAYSKSNTIFFDVKVPVTLVTLTPTSITGVAGGRLNLTCTTSYCNPKANITWNMPSPDISSQSTSTNKEKGLVRTVSSLLINLGKSDNGKQVYCTASNIKDQSVSSTVKTLTVEYKPEVTAITQSPVILMEKTTALLKCNATAANPAIGITWKWFKIDNPSIVLHKESTYNIFNIQREKSGFYNCTATNKVGTSDAAMIKVDVQYAPEVISNTTNPYIIEEKQTAKLDCTVTAANPDTGIEWSWFKTDTPGNILYNEPSYTIVNIQKEMAGSYNCTATNSVGTSVAATIEINVHYRPEVKIITINPYKISEGLEAKLECTVITANPKTGIIWKWIRTNNALNPVFNGSAYIIPNITKNESGSYNCTAANSAGISEPVMITVDVQYKPMIVGEKSIKVNESDRVVLTQGIDSNPLSNVSWYDGSKLLEIHVLMTTATYIIEKAACTDTKNFTIVATNKADYNVTAMVELIVNCKPRSIKTNFTLGLGDTTGIEFSTTVIAYPEPELEVKHENGTINSQMTYNIIRNGIYRFTIHLSQAVVNQSDFGVYHLILTNAFGKVTIFVDVIPKRKPNMPNIFEPVCEIKRARIQWTSSFNGGEPQKFTVITLNAQSKSSTTPDKGENEIHAAYVQNLKSSTTYVFYVSAQNSHGITSSANVSCTTSEEEGVNLPLIAGGAVAGGITLAIIVIAIVLMFRRYTKNEKQAGKPHRLKDELCENRDTDDDGLKENILYVSADTRDIDKPESAVYAAVNKKSQESNNNANVYAEVNKSEPKIREGALYSDVKPKKGFFKKNEQDKVGDKPKQRKGKKQKTKQEIADVYENSEDIAMTPNVDNVYSNSEHKNQSETKQRGYKNKDGLLYVEVNFDGKQGQDNPVIHGEDEKTDYATVEFPMTSALHKASGSEEL